MNKYTCELEQQIEDHLGEEYIVGIDDIIENRSWVIRVINRRRNQKVYYTVPEEEAVLFITYDGAPVKMYSNAYSGPSTSHITIDDLCKRILNEFKKLNEEAKHA